MKQQVQFTIKYYTTLILLFIPLRLLFLFVDGEKSYNIGDYLDVALQGLKLDIAIAGYITSVPLILVLANILVRLPIKRILIPYNIIAATIIAAAFVADISLYPFWGFKLDGTFLLYIDSPSNALASVSSGYILIRLAITIALATFTSLLLTRITPEKFNNNNRKVLQTFTFLIIGGLMFLGIRGGVTESTNNIGRVYYSDDLFLNHSAINPIFNFIYSLRKIQDFSEEYVFFAEEERKELFDSLYIQDDNITDTLLNNNRPNIVTIVLEGMGAVFVDKLGGNNIARNISRLSEEGILFSNCHANSFRTDRGLVCLLSGYPSFPQISVMKSPIKSQNLPSFAGSLSKVGYKNTLLYGGDINFTNMKSYFYYSGYNKLIVDSDFSFEQQETHQWGVNDDIVFDTLYSIIQEMPKKEPWQITYLTLSSHEPWTVPYSKYPDDKIANAFAYTDSCFGVFIDKMKKSDLWENTLIICAADHTVGAYPTGKSPADKDYNHITVFLLGGAVKKPTRIETLCNQSDIVATILSQMRLPINDYKFSRNILSPKYKYPFAYSSYNNGISFIDSTGFSTFDLDSKKVLKEEPDDSYHNRLKRAKAILQSTYQDYKQK